VVLRTVSGSEDDSAVHVDLAVGEPDTERGRTAEGESGESAEGYVDLAVSEHGAKRDGTAQRCIRRPRPQLSRVEAGSSASGAGQRTCEGRRLVVKPHTLGQETVAAARPRPYRAWCCYAPSAMQRTIQRCT
jgi:hypothetical protein